jgi:hypothetical protein
MRPLLAAFFACLTLLGQLPLSAGTHWCGGEAAQVRLLLGEVALHCGEHHHEHGCARHRADADGHSTGGHASGVTSCAHGGKTQHARGASEAQEDEGCTLPGSAVDELPCCTNRYHSLDTDQATDGSLQRAELPGLLVFLITLLGLGHPPFAFAGRVEPTASPPWRKHRAPHAWLQVFRQ